MPRSCHALATAIDAALPRRLLGSALRGFGARESVEEFYRGKQIRLIVGNAVGADYDLGARLARTAHEPPSCRAIPRSWCRTCRVPPASAPPTTSPALAQGWNAFRLGLAQPAGQAVIGRAALKVDPREFRLDRKLGHQHGRLLCPGCEPHASTADDLFTRDLIVGGIGSGSTQSTVPTALQPPAGHALQGRRRLQG